MFRELLGFDFCPSQSKQEIAADRSEHLNRKMKFNFSLGGMATKSNEFHQAHRRAPHGLLRRFLIYLAAQLEPT
ncbi:hypothetical protein D9M68_321230 [compost metagenome]